MQEIVNPFHWEIGHVAWFQENWVLRHGCRREPLFARSDEFYDSITITHDERWELPLPTIHEALAYLGRVEEATLEVARERGEEPEMRELLLLTVGHQDMHNEAFTYMHQTLGYAQPAASECPDLEQAEAAIGDREFGAGSHFLGAARNGDFCFDNERWGQEVDHGPFAISRCPVTQSDFCAFVDDKGYERLEFWSREGRTWLAQQHESELTARLHPIYWRKRGHEWQRRHFDEWLPLEDDLPVHHITWFEAEAWCRWADRRLPTELEWEVAAGEGEPAGKRDKPWGNEPTSPRRANLDWTRPGCTPVQAHPDGDTPGGVRGLHGNVWEWTADDFRPFPGFSPMVYREYSAPWFGDRKVLKGGAWATPSRLVRNGFRNFFQPWRSDAIAGFRSCALG